MVLRHFFYYMLKIINIIYLESFIEFLCWYNKNALSIDVVSFTLSWKKLKWVLKAGEILDKNWKTSLNNRRRGVILRPVFAYIVLAWVRPITNKKKTCGSKNFFDRWVRHEGEKKRNLWWWSNWFQQGVNEISFMDNVFVVLADDLSLH